VTRNSGRPASLADVARLARVSVPTAPRVITRSARVSEDKVERVEAAIIALGYRPNGAARALVSGIQNIVVVLASNTTYYGYAATIRGIEEAARAAEHLVMIVVIESEDEAHVRDAVRLALSQPVAGVIVLKSDRAGVALPATIPVAVASGSPDETHAQALIDEFAGGRATTEYLLTLGHRTVHHVSVPPSGVGEDERTRGSRAALVSADTDAPPVIPASWDPGSGRRIGSAIARRADMTGTLCGNDEIAMGIVRGLTDEGVDVPGKVSVVGFDDHPLAGLWRPGLTTVNQDFPALGRRAYMLLTEVMAGRQEPDSTREPTRLIVRESAAPPSPRGRRHLP